MLGSHRRLALASVVLASACAAPEQPRPEAPAARNDPSPLSTVARRSDVVPLGELPTDVRPTHYTVVLQIEPEKERFAGTVEIAVELAKRQNVIFLHAQGLHIKGASVRTAAGQIVPATLDQVHASGLGRLAVAGDIGPGPAVIHVDYDAPFEPPGDPRFAGLHHVHEAGKVYAVTQLEALFARRVFPSFDQPSFKTPFDVTLFVPKGMTAIGNTPVVQRTSVSGLDRVTFATTLPLPTYLVAVAVGPFDVVDGPPVPPGPSRPQPVPLRGVVAAGRGREIGYAMAHTGEVLAALERYFGTAYPYPKLDLLAVPEAQGAMENPGAVTFREWLLLLDDKADLDQRRGYYGVVAHELAHMWFGDLVTMKWWDDIWLNEAFATWMGQKVSGELRPELRQDLLLQERGEQAMDVDALVHARQIRQPVRDANDVANAFDAITYSKGGAVLAMFERFLGAETFQKGIRLYLSQHRFGAATADDLLAALSTAAGRDVATPFKTFLDQPGVPLVEAELRCDGGPPRLHVTQSRFLPLGSTGDAHRTWQVPLCVAFADGAGRKEACALVTKPEEDVPLAASSCPAWVHPNAAGAGYLRWTLPPAQTKALATKGLARLDARERMSFANGIGAAFARGKLSAGDAIAALAPLAGDASHFVAGAPGSFVGRVADWFSNDPALVAKARAFVGALYAPAFRSLGWEARKGADDDADRKALRHDVLASLAFFVRDAAVRKEGAAKGRAYVGYGGDGALHPEAVEANVAEIALALAVEEGDAAFFDALVARLGKTDDEAFRLRILHALGHARKPELAARALALALDPSVHSNEWTTVLDVRLAEPETRAAAWSFLREHFAELLKRPARRAKHVTFGGVFCDTARADEIEKTFAPEAEKIEGGPRVLASTVETVRLCAARRAGQEPGARAFFAKSPRP